MQFPIDDNSAEGPADLAECTIKSLLGNPATVQSGDRRVRLETTKGKTIRLDGEPENAERTAGYNSVSGPDHLIAVGTLHKFHRSIYWLA